MKILKNHLLSILIVGFFLFIAFGSMDDNDSSTSSSTNDSYSSEPAKSEVTKPILSGISEETIKQNLIGKWQLDSVVATATDEMKKNLPYMRNTRLRKDGKIVMYNQPKYKKEGDDVQIDEFKSNGKYLRTHIYDYSVKHEASGKQISTYYYEINGSKIVSILKWGKNNENETKSNLLVVKIDSQNLIYNFDNYIIGQTDTYYYSKLK